MTARKLSIITAMARNRVIGINNTLPWRIPEDLRRFKALTMGRPIIMGRKTFDSIGKPLSGRTTIIVTRNRELNVAACPSAQPQKGDSFHTGLPTRCLVAYSLDEALASCAGEEEVFIAGGAQLYAQALPLADTLYITELQQDVDGDTFFPELDKSAWQEIARERHSQVEPQALEYHFVTYRHRK